MPLPRALILDRDGTINTTGPADNGGYILRAQLDDGSITLRPNAREGLAAFAQNGVQLFVFTQQNCVAKGLIDHAGIDAVHAHIQSLLGNDAPIHAFYYNTHPNAGPDWDKPAPGMINAILADHNLHSDDVLVVGDAPRDFQSATSAKTKFAYVRSDDEQKHKEAKETGAKIHTDLLALYQSIAG